VKEMKRCALCGKRVFWSIVHVAVKVSATDRRAFWLHRKCLSSAIYNIEEDKWERR
jgi:hypothetical protein